MLENDALRAVLTALVRVVCDEADRNPQFARRLARALTGKASAPSNADSAEAPDPFVEHRERGSDGFAQWLDTLDIDQLRSIVRAHRLDPSRLSDKWKTKERFSKLVLERVEGRMRQGESFRQYGDKRTPWERLLGALVRLQPLPTPAGRPVPDDVFRLKRVSETEAEFEKLSNQQTLRIPLRALGEPWDLDREPKRAEVVEGELSFNETTTCWEWNSRSEPGRKAEPPAVA